MTIGAFSAATKLTVKALRLYEAEGILVPERVDPLTGYRDYGEDSWRRARVIGTLREFGFSHRELLEIVTACSDDGDLARFFEKRLREVESDMARLRSVRDRISLCLQAEAAGRKEGIMKRDTEIREKHLGEVLLCGIRYRGRYDGIGARFQELFRVAGRYASGAPMGLYYDGEYREDDADIEACVPVKKAVSRDGIECRVLEGVRALCAIHYGPYETIGNTYKLLFDSIEERGLTALAPSREVYLKGPGMIFPRKPERFVTEVQIPVGGVQ